MPNLGLKQQRLFPSKAEFQDQGLAGLLSPEASLLGLHKAFPTRFPLLVLEIQPGALNFLGKHSTTRSKAASWMCPHMVVPFPHVNSHGSFKKTPVSWDLAHN